MWEHGEHRGWHGHGGHPEHRGHAAECCGHDQPEHHGHVTECCMPGHFEHHRHVAACCCRHGHRFGRRFLTREERIARLQEYLKELQAEAKAVEEHLAELQAAGK